MANIKFSGFTAPGGTFTPARASTYFVGYDNSGGPDNVQMLISDIEGIINFPEYEIGVNATNPIIELSQSTGYSYGGATGSITLTGAGTVGVARTSATEITITGNADDTTSLPVKNSAGTVQFTSDETTGIRFAGSGASTVSFTAGTQLVTVDSTDTNYTYTLATADASPNIDIELTGGGGGADSGYTITAGTNITLTEDGSNTGFTIDADDTNTTYTLNNSTGAGTQCQIDLVNSGGGNAGTVILTPAGGLTITNPALNTYALSAPTSYAGWTQSADSGSDNVINSADTLDILGGTVIGTVSSATSGKEVTINHSSVTRSDTTSTASPAAGGTFTCIDSVTTSAEGHITAANVKTVTLPAAGGGGGGLTPTIKIANYTAASGDFIICNVTGTLDITLPSAASSSAGDIIGVKYASQNAQTDKLRVFTDTAGDLIDGTDRSASPLPIPSVNTYYEFIYGSANNWYIK